MVNRKDYRPSERQHTFSEKDRELIREERKGRATIREENHKTSEREYSESQKDKERKSYSHTGRLSLSEIKKENSRAGQYFFSKDTMRMYRQVDAKYSVKYDKSTDTNYVIVNMKKYPESNERKNVVYKYNKENGHLDIQI